MKILYVVSLWGQPTETFVRREIAAGRAAGHEIQVLSLKPPRPVSDGPAVVYLPTWSVILGALADAARHPIRATTVAQLLRGSSLRNLPRHGFAIAVALAARRRLGEPDWVHAHFAWLSATTAWALSELFDVPFGVMPHAHDIYEHELIDGVLRRKLAAADVVVVESELIRSDVTRMHGREPDVLRMGVPDGYVESRRQHSGRGRRVVSVGALRAKKGHDTLVEAIATIPDAELRIVGDGAERQNLESRIAQLGVADRVTLVGHVEEAQVADELDRADVFALASRVTPEGDRDGVPNVLIEAMARGVPVAGTDVAGIPDLLLPDRGTVVESNDPEGLASAIEELLADPDLRSRRSALAQKHVRDHYTVGANWQRLESMLTEAISSRRR